LFSVVEFIDPLSREDVYKLYQSADLILMPSLDLETLGMITLESISFGTPVMGFEHGGTREILANFSFKDLFLLKKVDASCLADGILNFVHTSAKVKETIRNEVRNVSKEFIFNNHNRVSLFESITEISSASNH
jgi:glycosyltransferase involved in cell wall biosynthesis